MTNIRHYYPRFVSSLISNTHVTPCDSSYVISRSSKVCAFSLNFTPGFSAPPVYALARHYAIRAVPFLEAAIYIFSYRISSFVFRFELHPARNTVFPVRSRASRRLLENAKMRFSSRRAPSSVFCIAPSSLPLSRSRRGSHTTLNPLGTPTISYSFHGGTPTCRWRKARLSLKAEPRDNPFKSF